MRGCVEGIFRERQGSRGPPPSAWTADSARSFSGTGAEGEEQVAQRWPAVLEMKKRKTEQEPGATTDTRRADVDTCSDGDGDAGDTEGNAENWFR